MGASMVKGLTSRHLIRFVLMFFLLFSSLLHAADDDPVRVLIKQYNRDVYTTMDGLLYIRTDHCLESAYSENAILFYVLYSDDNKLRFSSNTECKVLEVYDRGAHYSREGR